MVVDFVDSAADKRTNNLKASPVSKTKNVDQLFSSRTVRLTNRPLTSRPLTNRPLKQSSVDQSSA